MQPKISFRKPHRLLCLTLKMLEQLGYSPKREEIREMTNHLYQSDADDITAEELLEEIETWLVEDATKS